jgi:hypothetical protein
MKLHIAPKQMFNRVCSPIWLSLDKAQVMPLTMSLHQMSLLLFTFHIGIRWEMKFQTNIESGLSLQ